MAYEHLQLSEDFNDYLDCDLFDGQVLGGNCFVLNDIDHRRRLWELGRTDYRYWELIYKLASNFSEENPNPIIRGMAIDHIVIQKKYIEERDTYRERIHSKIDLVYNNRNIIDLDTEVGPKEE